MGLPCIRLVACRDRPLRDDHGGDPSHSTRLRAARRGVGTVCTPSRTRAPGGDDSSYAAARARSRRTPRRFSRERNSEPPLECGVLSHRGFARFTWCSGLSRRDARALFVQRRGSAQVAAAGEWPRVRRSSSITSAASPHSPVGALAAAGAPLSPRLGSRPLPGRADDLHPRAPRLRAAARAAAGHRRWAQRDGDGDSAASAAASSLSIHFHALLLEGVFATAPDGTTRFYPAPPPTDRDVARLSGDDPHPRIPAGSCRRRRRAFADGWHRGCRGRSLAVDAPVLAQLQRRRRPRFRSAFGDRAGHARAARRSRARCPVSVDGRPTPRVPRTLRPPTLIATSAPMTDSGSNASAATCCAHRSRKSGSRASPTAASSVRSAIRGTTARDT